ncbi:MAG TPA: DUF455 family protein [Verrucomicrobiae bacterium]|nr:DUF455 family protein [Verrucomicrobiae bacterium]
MELREFAEQVLFATSLEEKLRAPENISDERPGSPLITPAAPGRPTELRFKPQVSGKADFPGLHGLEQPRERGRLLHFFANHELLATELMALVLLRFPDAPAAFRKGVLQTLKDEQEHTRLYIERMKACGIHFGELPVSGYFWRTVSAMENPMDYVSSLCLTFEQANLDFARHFANGFAQVGDADTSKLLHKIYKDEIGHVAYGLKWFRRWKNPTESDWEAFCRQLKFPLSPQRAKGFSLNVEGRRAAGLDPQFIAELNVYSQSKGRTPSVFVFNPFAEARIAQGKTFNPSKHQAQLARDLENLPQFLCREDDIVLVEKRPSVEFLSSIKQAGFPLPEFIEMALTPSPSPIGWERVAEGRVRAHTSPIQNLRSRKLGRLRPWAWGPDSLELLAPLLPNVTAEQRSAEQRFNQKIARLYSKRWSAEFLRKIISNSKFQVPNSTSAETRDWLCTMNEVGVAVNSIEAALETISTIRKRGHHKIVVKESLGLAGSNAMRLFEPDLLESHRRWMANALSNGRVLVIEPWLERELDFSVQLEMTGDGLKLRGYTGLLNDAKGQFQANWAESHHHKRIPAAVIARFPEIPDISSRLLRLYANIFKRLESELREVDYLGPIGIDAFVYRTTDGGCRIKPIVEINPRYTMGRLTVELMKQACPGSAGLFRIVNRPALRQAGFDNFSDYADWLMKKFPVQLEGEPTPRIRSGALCLNDPARVESFLAVFQVDRDLDRLRP